MVGCSIWEKGRTIRSGLVENSEIFLKMHGWTEIGDAWVPSSLREFWPDSLSEFKERPSFGIGDAVDIQVTLNQYAEEVLHGDGELRIESDAIDILDEFVDIVGQEVYEMAYDLIREKDRKVVTVKDAENAIIAWKRKIMKSDFTSNGLNT